jgi:hypothetical protein
MHSAKWDSTYDLTGKTVAVVGGGSSAVQLVPSIQPSTWSPDPPIAFYDMFFLTRDQSCREIDPFFEIASVDHNRFWSQICWAWRHKFQL